MPDGSATATSTAVSGAKLAFRERAGVRCTVRIRVECLSTLRSCARGLHGLELMGDTEFGISQVAEVLARPVAGEDSHWPCEAARELIESGRYPGLTEQLTAAKYNLRGIVTYDPTMKNGREQLTFTVENGEWVARDMAENIVEPE